MEKTEKKDKRLHLPTWKDVGITLGILFIATIIAYGYESETNETINVVLFYTLSILLTSWLTEGYLSGIISALLSVLIVNYLFTYPCWSLNFTLDGYPVTFICMMVISVFVSTVTSLMKHQAKALAEKEKMLADVEKAKMRANLLRAVSHDLRTPLTGIIGASSTYLENEICLSDGEKKELVRNIREDANWLLNMVENLLSVTRIHDDTAARVNKTSEPVEEVVSEAVYRLKRRVPDANIKVLLPEEFIMIPMDPTLIEQVLNNILENAVYHSKSGEPVECRVEIEEEEVLFLVTSRGEGIAEEKLNTLFDGTGQSRDGGADGHKGIGIGLSICKIIVEAHGGRIGAQNYGQGTRFYFTLPREEKDNAE